MSTIPRGGAFERPLPASVRPATLGVRGGTMRSGFEETSEAIYLNSGFVYESAEAAEQAFTGEVDHFVYSRYGNPTVKMFEERLRLLEGAEGCYATASGMSAVFTALAALLGKGDRLVAARSLFGSCFVVCNEILPRWGVETVFVDGEDLDQWEQALSVPTTAVFFETPSNPMQTLVDVRRVSEMAHAAGAKVVLDNVFATPLLQRSLDLGADIVVYSGTKHIDGQGRVLKHSVVREGIVAGFIGATIVALLFLVIDIVAGHAFYTPEVLGRAVLSILGPQDYIDGPVQHLIRHTGPALSPFNAHTLLKGLETMAVRIRHSVESAERIARFLQDHAAIRWVKYPFLESHPQYDLARSQMSGGGTVVTFELDAPEGAGKKRAFELLDGLRIVTRSRSSTSPTTSATPSR